MKDQLFSTDIALIVAANLVNLLIAGVFIARGKGLVFVEYWLGLVAVALALPVATAAFLNLKADREPWTVYLPLTLICYLVLEFVLDYWVKTDFRSTWILWPYLIVFYTGLMAMIGYSFLVGRTFGFITLSSAVFSFPFPICRSGCKLLLI